MYEIIYSKQSAKLLNRMPRYLANIIRERLDQIAFDPFAEHSNVTKLQNRPGYRLRVGDWRVIYDLQKAQTVLLVIKIATGGEIYR